MSELSETSTSAGTVTMDDVFGDMTAPDVVAPTPEPTTTPDATAPDATAPDAVEAAAVEPDAEPADNPDGEGPDGEGASEAPITASDVLAAVRDAVPGIDVGETPEQAAEAVRGLYDDLVTADEAITNVTLAEEKAPGIGKFTHALAQGVPFFEAFIDAFKEYEAALDPDALDEVEQARSKKAMEAKIRGEVLAPVEQANQAKLDRWQADASRVWEAFAAAPPEGLDLDRFQETYRSLFDPDMTGRFRADHFKVVAKAVTYDADIKAARAEAEAKGYERALAEAKAKGYDLSGVSPSAGTHARRAGDGLPMSGAGGGRAAAPGAPRTPATVAYNRGLSLENLYE